MKNVIIGLFFFSIGTVLFFINTLPNLQDGLASNNWPTIAASIIEAQKIEITEKGGNQYHTNIRYEYSVSGKTYQSNQFQYGSDDASKSEADTDTLLSRYPVGSQTIIRYNPDNPQQSVLLPGLNSDMFIGIGVMLLFMAVGLVVVVVPVWNYNRWKKLSNGDQQPSTLNSPALAEIELTPSEMVILNGVQFAERKHFGGIMLLDGKTKVTKNLVLTMLKAALLAQEKVGTIRISMGKSDNGNLINSNQLMVIPTGKEHQWPQFTIESRLNLQKARPVDEIIREWLLWDSGNPWKRASEQAKILLTLRGIVRTEPTQFSMREYRWTRQPEDAELSDATQEASVLLNTTAEQRPDFNDQLQKQISKAFKSRRINDENSGAQDPWLDEAETDRQPYQKMLRFRDSSSLGIVGSLVLSIFVWIFAIQLLIAAECYLVASVGLLLYLTVYLFEWRLNNRERPIQTVIQHLILGIPGVIFVISLFVYGWQEFPYKIVAGYVVGGFFVARKLLKNRITDLITKRVTAPDQEPTTTIGEDQTHQKEGSENRIVTESQSALTIQSIQQPLSSFMNPLRIKIIESDELPPTSDASRARLEAIRERGPQIRRIYALGLAFIATATTSMALAVSVLKSSLSGKKLLVEEIIDLQSGTVTFFVITMIIVIVIELMIRFTVPKFRRVIKETEGLTQQKTTFGKKWKTEVLTIRPVLVPFLGGLWVLLSLNLVEDLVSVTLTWRWLMMMLSLAIPTFYLFWVWKQRTALEKKYPVYPPLNLLALRVFGSSDMEDYLALTDRWHWFGPLQMLDGPDTAGAKFRDFIYFLSGNIEKSIVENQTELLLTLADSKNSFDSQLRFSDNSMQCNDSTWQEALDLLLKRSHVIVMDLSGFSEENRGCAHELDILIDRIPLSQFILLVNDSTDMQFLNTILQEVWAKKSSLSSTTKIIEPTIQLFKIGGSKMRRQDESVVGWKGRMMSRIDKESLVGMLYDAALSERTADEKRDLMKPQVVDWGRVQLPRVLRIIRNVAFVLFCFKIFLNLLNLF